MSASRTPDSIAATVAALRSAGCVYAEDEARLLTESARDEDDLAGLLSRRTSGVPLEQVLGWAEFRGLRIAIDANVFVPRRRTELLADEAVARAHRARDSGRRPCVVELCCGSGAVSAVLLAECGDIELYAGDIDPAAVQCAQRNVAVSPDHLHVGDLYAALPPSLRGRVDVVVANAPYVPTSAIEVMPPEARLYEPHTALDGGPDGLDVLRRVIAGAPDWLIPGGHLLVESSAGQVAHLQAAARGAGLLPRVRRSHDLDATIVIATRPADGTR